MGMHYTRTPVEYATNAGPHLGAQTSTRHPYR